MQQTIKKLYNALEDAFKIGTLGTGTYAYIKELLDELSEKVSPFEARVMQKIAEVICPNCGESGRVKRADDSKVDLHCKNCGNYWFDDSNFSA